MIKYFIIRDFRSTCSWFICRNAEGVHALVSECLKGTWETKCWELLSIKICRSLLQVPHNDCACSYFRPKAFNDMALCIASLAGGNTIAISTGETNKNVTVKFLKKHMTSSTLHFFSSLCSTAAPKTYNFLKTKHTTHRAYVVTVRTRAVKILHTRAKHVK